MAKIGYGRFCGIILQVSVVSRPPNQYSQIPNIKILIFAYCTTVAGLL